MPMPTRTAMNFDQIGLLGSLSRMNLIWIITQYIPSRWTACVAAGHLGNRVQLQRIAVTGDT